MTIIQFRKVFSGVLAAILMLPFAPIILWSLSNRWRFPNVWPEQFGISGWRGLAESGGISALLQSIMISFLVVTVAVPIGFAAAWATIRLEHWPARLFEAVLFAPVFLPPFVLVMGVTTESIFFNFPAGGAVVVTLSVLALPYVAFIFRSAFLTYGSVWEEEGSLLGAKWLRIVLQVRMPMLRNSILAASLIAFLVGWSDYIVTLTVGGGQVLTLPLLIGSSASAPGNDSTLAAMSIVSIVIPALAAMAIRSFSKREKSIESI